MSRDQRWAASGVVVLLGALWALVGAWAVSEPYRQDPPGDDMTGAYVFGVGVLVLGVDALWLVAGLVAVARVGSGTWRWRPVAAVLSAVALLSLLSAGASWSAGDEIACALFGFQAVALVAYAALLRVPVAGQGAPS